MKPGSGTEGPRWLCLHRKLLLRRSDAHNLQQSACNMLLNCTWEDNTRVRTPHNAQVQLWTVVREKCGTAYSEASANGSGQGGLGPRLSQGYHCQHWRGFKNGQAMGQESLWQFSLVGAELLTCGFEAPRVGDLVGKVVSIRPVW